MAKSTLKMLMRKTTFANHFANYSGFVQRKYETCDSQWHLSLGDASDWYFPQEL
jgi:hypothetical protein